MRAVLGTALVIATGALTACSGADPSSPQGLEAVQEHTLSAITSSTTAPTTLTIDPHWLVNHDLDLNGDGKADLCGRGAAGIWCALSSGSDFGKVTRWSADYSDQKSFSFVDSYSTISYPDLDGDGRSDVCGRIGEPLGNGWTGTSPNVGNILCALSTGSGFGTATNWKDWGGYWDSVPQYFTTIRFPDLDGDGKGDFCERGSEGIMCGLNTGSGFGDIHHWSPAFSDANGWDSAPEYYGTIAFPDLNGDGKADVCGRGAAGIWCGLSTGGQVVNGNWEGFTGPTLWSGSYSDRSGWYANASTIRFPDLNGDGKADVCGRGSSGILCALSSGSAFGPASLWSTAYSDAAGWNLDPDYYATIRFPDLNGDGKADVCGRGGDGIWCALSTGRGFGAQTLWSGNYSDYDGWNQAPYYSTIAFADTNGDGRADICGRGPAGALCALSSGSAFGTASTWSAAYSDANGWATSEAYYGTVRF
jgi:hypothetical protein